MKTDMLSLNNSANKWLLLFVILSAISVATASIFGPTELSISDLTQCVVAQCSDAKDQLILFEIRVPRVLFGFIAGAALAVSGVVLQGTTANPLADPYLFGVVAGAGLGATMATLIFPDNNLFILPVAAFAGAFAAVLLVVALALVVRQVIALILVGVALSFMLSAITHFLLYMGDPFATNRIIFWLMGSLSRSEISHIYVIFPVIMLGMIAVLSFAKQLDALMLGDETAQTLGINVNRVRLIMLVVCAGLTAVVVAFCGGIGFVGLMIPHIARQIFGVTTFKLVLGSALLGGLFLVWIDVLARTTIPGQEIPIGVITSAIGSLFFLFVLYQKKGQFNV